MKRGLFLDRDGVLNVDTGYIGDPDQLVLIPGIVPVLHRAKALGYMLVVITNQSGIARGYFSEDNYAAVSARLRRMFAEQGIDFAGIYHCPHHPDGKGPLAIRCSCRKPLPGLIFQAAQELEICLECSIMIGDKQSDVQAAVAAGMKRQFLLRHSACAKDGEPTDDFAEIKHYLESSNRGSVCDRGTDEVKLVHPVQRIRRK